MQELDNLMDQLKVDIIKETLTNSRNLMDKLSEYDDMPASKTFEEDIISTSKVLSKQLYSSGLILEYINGN